MDIKAESPKAKSFCRLTFVFFPCACKNKQFNRELQIFANIFLQMSKKQAFSHHYKKPLTDSKTIRSSSVDPSLFLRTKVGAKSVKKRFYDGGRASLVRRIMGSITPYRAFLSRGISSFRVLSFLRGTATTRGLELPSRH